MKLAVAALVAMILVAGAPNTASAHHIYYKYIHHMKKMKIVGGKHFGFGGGPGPIFVCAGGIIVSALIANATQQRELSWDGAASCGLLYWLSSNH